MLSPQAWCGKRRGIAAGCSRAPAHGPWYSDPTLLHRLAGANRSAIGFLLVPALSARCSDEPLT